MDTAETASRAANAPETSLFDWTAANAQRAPDDVFIDSIDQNKTITHGQFFSLTNRMAQFLQSRGLGPNDRVAMLSSNCIEHLAAYIGVMRFGPTICTIHVEMNAVYFERILTALKPRIVLYQETDTRIDVETLKQATDAEWIPLGNWRAESGGTGFYGLLEGFPDEPLAPLSRREDDASIFYTSGTASAPKGVILNFRELIDNTPPVAEALKLTPADRILEFRAFNWVSAQVLSGLAPLSVGATILLARHFSQSRYFNWVRDKKATIGICNPTGLAMFLNRPIPVSHKDFPHLRFMTSSSAPLMMETWKQFEERYGVPVAQGYGCSEIGWICVTNEDTRRMGTVGRPLAYHKLTVVDQNGNALPDGEMGEIELGGFEHNVYRYIAEDGEEHVHATDRLRTGDLGYFDEEGCLRITGRAKDLIIRGGVNISPAEIENILLQMPDMAEAAAIGVPDAIYGEEVVCYVAPKHGHSITVEQVAAHCTANLPEFRRPRQVIVRDALPKTERGKMHRLQLLDEWKAEFGKT
jgi:acyl-coenzyme A synthetase/AMP-(fatty) acid ligase